MRLAYDFLDLPFKEESNGTLKRLVRLIGLEKSANALKIRLLKLRLLRLYLWRLWDSDRGLKLCHLFTLRFIGRLVFEIKDGIWLSLMAISGCRPELLFTLYLLRLFVLSMSCSFFGAFVHEDSWELLWLFGSLIGKMIHCWLSVRVLFEDINRRRLPFLVWFRGEHVLFESLGNVVRWAIGAIASIGA